MIGLGNCLESWLSLGGQGPALKALKEQSLLPWVVKVGLGRGRADGKCGVGGTLSGRLQCRAGVCTTAELP